VGPPPPAAALDSKVDPSRQASRKLKILTIAHNAVAASNRQRFDALRNLADVEVSLLTPHWWFEEGRRIDVPRSAPWRVGRTAFSGNGTRYVYLTGLIEALRQEKPDVIDLYEEPFSLVAFQTLVLRALLAPRAAIVFYSAVNVQRQWRWPYRWIERLMLKHADGAHAPNQDVAPILRTKGLCRQPVSVIPLGVDPEPFSTATPMELPGIPRPRVGFVGRLEPVKGLDVLLDAFARLTTPATLVIAGDGTQRARLQARIAATPPPAEQVILSIREEFARFAALAPSRLSEKWKKNFCQGAAERRARRFTPDTAVVILRACAKFARRVAAPWQNFSCSPENRKGASAATRASSISPTAVSEAKDPRPVVAQGSRIHLLPPVSYEDMPSFLKSLDILVLPSVTILPLHREQFGRVLVEAMAAGVAVIGSSSGAIPEVIGDAGLIVPERDPIALADAIERLLTDNDQRQALVERGRQRVRDRFAWPVVAEQTNDLFRAAVAHRRQVTVRVQAVSA
jgi:glycosyltransferase involved in cell wall biosynthesis